MKRVVEFFYFFLLLFSLFFNYYFCVELNHLDSFNKDLDYRLVSVNLNVKNLTVELEKSVAREKALEKALGEALRGKK
jgi:hypothetical protein